MRKIVLLLGTLCAGAIAGAQAGPVFTHASAPAEVRIGDLLDRMTLDEKIDALGTNPTVPRLGVVGTGHVEGLHGLALGGPGGWEGRNQTVIPTTQFPQARGLGQTWDPRLIEQAAAAEAYEARYADGKYHRGGMVVRAPNVDLSRDPRWGRSEESYGEDPFLVGTMATAFTRGLQGDGRYWMTASLLKHFLANSNEQGRSSSSSDFDARLFHEYYAEPFRMAIQEGGANAFMTSYNAWNNVPMTANPALREIVMKQWGFDGIVCTDAGALANLVKTQHAYATMPEAVAAALHAGINQFLDAAYKPALNDALKQGLVTEADLDRNLRGVFRVMLRLGMLDPRAEGSEPRIGMESGPVGDPWMKAESRALARKVTDESIVLLKNRNGLLPLSGGTLKSIAVIGPLADTVALDWYSGTPPYTVTPLAGIRSRAGAGVKVEFSNGADLAEVATMAKRADVAIVLIGNHPTCDAGWAKCPLPSDGKEGMDRKTLSLAQEEIARVALAANPKTVVVLQASFPFTTTWTERAVPAIVQMTHNSQEQGNALADVLFGDYNPAGRLTQTWVASEDDLPPMMDYNIRHGRTYLYAKQTPLYAFGYGLSYTQFKYRSVQASAATITAGQTVKVTIELQNEGDRDGDEVVQMYVAHPGSAVERPREELKGFARVSLKAGERRTVTLPLAASALAYWQESKGAFALEAGTVEVRVGGSSDKLPLMTTVQVMP